MYPYASRLRSLDDLGQNFTRRQLDALACPGTLPRLLLLLDQVISEEEAFRASLPTEVVLGPEKRHYDVLRVPFDKHGRIPDAVVAKFAHEERAVLGGKEAEYIVANSRDFPEVFVGNANFVFAHWPTGEGNSKCMSWSHREGWEALTYRLGYTDKLFDAYVLRQREDGEERVD